MAPNPTGCFALCCAAGVVLGFLLHLLELPRRRPLALKAVTDFMFCGLCTLVLMLLCLTWNGGMLRLFQPLGLLLGMRLYFAGFGVLTRKIADRISASADRCSRKAKQLFSAATARTKAKKLQLFSGKSIDNS